MAIRGGGRRGSFGGLGTAASSVDGASEGGPHAASSPSRQQSGTSLPSASQRERSSQVISVSQGRGRGGYNAGQGRSGHDDASGSSTGRGGGRGGYSAGQGRSGYDEASGSSTGRGSRGHHGGGREGRKTMDPIEALGRCMSAILRHQAADYNIEMKSDGYVLVSDLLKQRKNTAAGIPLFSHTEDDVRKAVAEDNKQRFGLKEDNGELYIRAVQGHTIKIVESEHLLKPITAPSEVPVCVHGTYVKFLDSIWEEGLKRMTRNHIHFATGLPKEDGIISGMRASAQVLIYLDVGKAIEDGMKLYISENKVVLTEGFNGAIPAKYFKKVIKRLRDGTEVSLIPPHDRLAPNIAAEAKAEHPITSPSAISVCVYCTNEKLLKSIWEEGLKISKDKRIHFASGLPKVDCSTIGMRGAAQVLIYLNVEKAFEDGMKLYTSDKEVVTEGFDGVIPDKYFKRVIRKLPNGGEIPLFPPRQARNSAADA